jgi:hypothetical protein
MKKNIFTITVIVFAFLANVPAQVRVDSTGRVGIGIENPQYNAEDITNKTITDNKVWNIDIGYPCPESEGTICFCYRGLRTYKTGNHYTFGGKEYTGILSNLDSNDTDEYTIAAYLREENNQVFFYSEKCGKEFLMYDFNLQAGDKVILNDYFLAKCDLNEQGETENGGSYLYTAVNIDSVIYNQVKYKRIELQGEMHLYWIEGVGDIMGILYHSAAWGGSVPQLKDCYLGDNLFFLNDNPQYCFTTNIQDVNPDRINIFTGENNMLHIINAKEIPLSIYDAQGKKIKSIYPDNDNYEINISYIPKGLYLLKVYDINNQISSFKIIKK